MTLEGRSKPIFVVTITFLCVSFIAVALRCFVRLKLVKAFGWDDGSMVFVMALNIWFATCGIAGSIYGIGKKFDEFDSSAEIKRALFVNFPKIIHPTIKWWWLGQSAYVWVVTITKISVAMSILRFTMRQLHSAIMYAIIGVTSAIDIAFWFVLMLQCQPVREFWQRTGQGHCINTDYVINVAYLYSATACICDFMLVVTAGHLLKDLPMTRRTQWGLTGIISMGCIASAAVVARIPYLHNYKDSDFLYATANISILSNIEAGLGITAGSLNTVRPLVRWFRGISDGESRSAGSTSGNIIHCSFSGTRSHPLRVNSNSSEYWRQCIEFGNSGYLTTASRNQMRRGNSQELYHECL
ncbi:hypothetical protein N7532_000006 [Penicillium argentinense]|uniref:Rhodopsin domain-containing protein n=1 Tax=Penicillium argentinense TaxID=1131581 RepID=A0A9W9KNE7_9EURO|nr:uncharacterized protein N7532_000006 [Penicillium argentinense]KAJ5111961.1 hypothetical protein N7532_000006 [Penicillium argentinense]